MNDVRSDGGPQRRVRRERPEGWVQLVNALLRGRRLTVRLAVGLFIVVAMASLLKPRTYTTSAAFMPQASPSAAGRLAGLAAQFGLTAPVTGLGNSPEFYADLVRSGQILRPVVLSQYTFQDGEAQRTGTLVEIYEIDAQTDGRRVTKAVTRLSRNLSVRVDPKTFVVKLSVRARQPDLAEAIVNRVLEEVNRFNLQSRQGQAGEERKFVEKRLEDALGELRASEDRLEVFLVRNREYRNAPQLAFEYDRLEREVAMRQQVYTTLAQSYEQARIEEVRNTPVITLVESPIVAPMPDRRYLLLRGVLALLAGCMIGGVVALSRELMRVTRKEDPGEAVELNELWVETIQDLRRPWRMLIPARASSRGGGDDASAPWPARD